MYTEDEIKALFDAVGQAYSVQRASISRGGTSLSKDTPLYRAVLRINGVKDYGQKYALASRMQMSSIKYGSTKQEALNRLWEAYVHTRGT